jgi:hypothetical protein
MTNGGEPSMMKDQEPSVDQLTQLEQVAQLGEDAALEMDAPLDQATPIEQDVQLEVFLIGSFHHALNVICFLLGVSPASEY